MKKFIASNGYYLLAAGLLLTAIVVATKDNDAAQQSSPEPQTVLSIRSVPTKSLNNRTSKDSSLANKVDAEHQVEYDLDDAILTFEDKVRQNSEKLDTRDLELFAELISNLNEYQSNETGY